MLIGADVVLWPSGSLYSFDDEWDDDSDDGKSTGGPQADDGGTMQRGGAHSTMKISLNK